jgi:transcriptional regulator with XRE-family HTH domain
MTTWGEELRAARLALGLAQHEVADKVGVWQASVCTWERGNAFPSRESYERLKSELFPNLSEPQITREDKPKGREGGNPGPRSDQTRDNMSRAYGTRSALVFSSAVDSDDEAPEFSPDDARRAILDGAASAEWLVEYSCELELKLKVVELENERFRLELKAAKARAEELEQRLTRILQAVSEAA